MFNFKKLAAVIFASVIIAVPFAVNAQYEDINADKNTINIIVDAERVIADNFLYNDTTYVQLRKIAEMLGKKVEWVESENAAYISDTDTPEITDETVVKLMEEAGKVLPVERNTITIYVNGVKVDADNFLFEDRTYVPLRKISEMFLKEVSWDQLTNTATIGAKKPSVFDGEVIGTINGREYTQKLFDDYKFMIETSNTEVVTAEIAEAMIMEQIIQDYAIIDLAIELGITAGVDFENEYQETMVSFADQLGSREALAELLKQSGFTEELYYYSQVVYDVYEKIIASDKFAVTVEECKAFYDANREEMFKYDGVRAKHVLVIPEVDETGTSTDAQWEEAKKTADKVYELAKSGKDFDELVAEYNQDPGMEQNPDGYYFTKGEMVAEFEEKSFSMEVGEISEPVKTVYGYHIIKLEEKIPYFEYDQDVEAFLKEELPAEKFYTYISEVASDAVVEKK